MYDMVTATTTRKRHLLGKSQKPQKPVFFAYPGGFLVPEAPLGSTDRDMAQQRVTTLRTLTLHMERTHEAPQASSTRYLLWVVTVVTSVTIVPKSSR